MSTTWDGLPVADDLPHGSSVTVRRPGRHGLEYLLLHRARHGRDDTGDWAWTVPSGARFPGEPVYPGALRELAEEAGITGPVPDAVDLAGPWATFLLDVNRDQQVDLVDPEHDRYAWVGADEAAARVSPAVVADGQIGSTRAIPRRTLTHRPMTAADVPLVVAWRTAPHVARWFPPHGDLADRLVARVAGDDPVAMTVTEVDGVPAASVQCYRLGDLTDDPAYVDAVGDPEAVAVDYLIGDPDLVGRGLGTTVGWSFCRDVVRDRFPAVRSIVASPDRADHASIRALAKCGFTVGGPIEVAGPRGVRTEADCRLDVGHVFGLVGAE